MTAIPFVRWAGIDIAPPESQSTTRRIYDHEIVYVLSGAGQVCWGERKCSAGADSCFFHLPRVAHSSSNPHSTPWVTLGIHFDWQIEPDAARFSAFRANDGRTRPDETLFREPRLIDGWDSGLRPVLDLRGRPAVRNFLEDAVTAYSHGDKFSRTQAGGSLVAALCQLGREAGLLAQNDQQSFVGPDARRRLNDARWLLEQVGGEMLTVAQVAARVGWSADYLGSMVKAEFGMSPRRLQTEARLQKARELLRDGQAVSEVAWRCGFSDTSHLARAFRKHSGLTPREYSSIAGRDKRKGRH
jgi:AraC-like DNA-binding protein